MLHSGLYDIKQACRYIQTVQGIKFPYAGRTGDVNFSEVIADDVEACKQNTAAP
jgi:hypothetical protein